MKILTLDMTKMDIHSRTILEMPDKKTTKLEQINLGKFFLAHVNGVDYIEFDSDELMKFIQMVYCLSSFDLFNDMDFEELIDINCSIYFSVDINNSRELKPFSYGEHKINSVSDLLTCFDNDVFKDGFNMNRIKAV